MSYLYLTPKLHFGSDLPIQSSPMKLLDLFCGAGGSTVGYSHHFDVTGLDHRYQLRFPFPNSFILCDALEFLQNNDVSKYDVIAASPPCQAYSSATNHAGWPDLIPDLRRALIATGKPYIIENVVGAPLIKKQTVLLCGSMFGLPLHRHRLFESNIPLHTTFCIHEWQKPIYTKHNNKPTSVMHVYGAGGGKGAEDNRHRAHEQGQGHVRRPRGHERGDVHGAAQVRGHGHGRDQRGADRGRHGHGAVLGAGDAGHGDGDARHDLRHRRHLPGGGHDRGHLGARGGRGWPVRRGHELERQHGHERDLPRR